MMNVKAEKNYWTASAQSFAAHKDRAEVPLTKDGVVEIPLGFQPYGINSQSLAGGGDAVLVADHFAPAVLIFDVWVADNTLRFEAVSWIHGAQNGITRCRGGFPDIPQPMGANRCVTAFWGPDVADGSVWIGRLEREFFVLTPSFEGLSTTPEKNAGVRWILSRRVLLPVNDEFPFIYSAAFIGGVLYTIEPNNKLDAYAAVQYEVVGEAVTENVRESFTGRSGGIARTGSGGLVTVTNAEVTDRERGIYCGSTLVVSEVSGTGICPLSNGGALVARYGQEAGGPFKGIPGALLYIPPSLLLGMEWRR